MSPNDFTTCGYECVLGIDVGGSIAKSFDFFGDAIRANLTDFPYPKSIEKLQILASDSNDSGVLGAASLCF